MDPSNTTKSAVASAPVNTNNAAAQPEAALQAHFERARALVTELGPANALRVMGGITGALATRVQNEGGDAALARDWSALARGMEQLADAPAPVPLSALPPPPPDDAEAADAGEAGAPEDDEEAAEDEDEEEPRKPRRERSRMRKMVAGMFDAGPQVETCRLREVDAMGHLAEVVGIANEQGIEDTEWPIGVMTPEFLRRLTGRGGKYRFEWFGRTEDGARVFRGRSRMFKVQGDTVKKLKKKKREAEAPPPSPAPTGFEQMLAFQRYIDDRTEREKARQTDLDKHREELASRERIEKLRADVELAKIRAESPAPMGELNAATIAALIDQRIEAHYGDDDDGDDDTPGGDVELPQWLQMLGINGQMLQLAAPFITQQIQSFIASKFGPNAPPGAPAIGYTPIGEPGPDGGSE